MIQQRIDRLNDSMGPGAIRVARASPAAQAQEFEANFLDALLLITLRTVPAEMSDEVWLWGMIRGGARGH